METLTSFHFCPKISTTINTLVLAANTAQSFTVPALAYKVILTKSVSSAALWVDKDAVAVIPVANVTDGSSPMLNPGIRQVAPGDVLSCICDEAVKVTAEFYA